MVIIIIDIKNKSPQGHTILYYRDDKGLLGLG